MSLVVYNTLTRRKEEFIPIDPELIRMYVCGPTVYSHAHIGHAKSYVSFDTIRRYLMYRYGREHLLYVMNITDVGHLFGDGDDGEDKVETQARRENRSPYEIAAAYEESFWEDMTKLNVGRPDRLPHATDFIRQQISMIERLIEKGLAYEVNGSVYFDVAEYERRPLGDGMIPYGGLSNRKTEDQAHGGRIAVNDEKRNPPDFAVWKRAEEEHFMQWFSPWGWGFPGWHIECSAMSRFYLGATFDIHGGGVDNQFPHHECEIAQSQAVNDKPFVRYWLHNNLVTTEGKKMGKSLGNATNLKALFERFDPMALRFFILQSHYGSTLEFDLDAVGAAQVGLDRLRRTIARLREAVGGESYDVEHPEFFSSFIAAMDDDFNTPLALGAIFEGINEANKLLADGVGDRRLLGAYLATFELALQEILGLDLGEEESGAGGALTGDLVDLLIAMRGEARARKDFAAADAIRDRLKEVGVVLEDTKDGTKWSVAAPSVVD